MTSERALEELYEAHSAALLSFCRHLLGSREEAEDVLQQTFVRALDALRSGVVPEHPRAWLFTIARNRALSVLAARREVSSDALVLEVEGLAEAVERRASCARCSRTSRRCPNPSARPCSSPSSRTSPSGASPKSSGRARHASRPSSSARARR